MASGKSRQGKKPRREDIEAAQAIAFVKSQRSRALTVEERLDILALQANLRADHAVVPRKESVTNKIARLLGRSNKTVGEVWSTFRLQGTVLVAAPPGNRGDHMTRLPRSTIMQDAVRAFIRSRCETRTRTTAKDVMHMLTEDSYLVVDTASTESTNAALRTVQRFLDKSGYTRGSHKGKSVRLSQANDVARAEYVQRMTSSESSSHRIVYMDESYIHHHYARHNDSLVDPTDENYVKEKHKGRRLCFIAAILDKDRTVSDEGRIPAESAQLLQDTVDIFEGGKQTADYHGMFCHDYFVDWMDKLLSSLDKRGLSNCLIVLDNAKYHKVLPTTTPKQGSRRSIMLDAMKDYGLTIPENSTKAILWKALSEHIKAHVVPVIVSKARAKGHDVAFTPPYHSDLQPIEIVWAIVKGEVGRQYSTSTKFADIQPRLERAFANLQSSTVQGCIDAANKQLTQLKEHLEAMDACEESSSDEEEEEEEEDSTD
jgi:hypothetical protein